uniref:Uncharacterized protein n=1 Tax=Rhizophora mucronata TaxID=61149 RepID=A0A2P2P942_RHIMU
MAKSKHIFNDWISGHGMCCNDQDLFDYKLPSTKVMTNLF